MIQLASVAMTFSSYGQGLPTYVFDPTTVSIPTDQPVAVLGHKKQGKSVLLRILAGVEVPTQGRVFTHARLSPVIKNGVLFRKRLSTVENIRFYARLLNVDPDQLSLIIDSFCRAPGKFHAETKAGGEELAKAAELAMLSVLSFDCYLIDEIGQLPENPREKLFDSAAERGAGIIFGCSQQRLARKFARSAVVVRDRTVYCFSNIEEAINFHER
jgi:capsular polysaccharide transport system ATP-binding protein